LEFLHLEKRQAVAVVLKYKAKLVDKGLKEAAVNWRLAAVKSLVEMGRQLGACHFTLGGIAGEKISATAIQQGLILRLLSGFWRRKIGQRKLASGTMLCCACCGVMP